MNKERIIEKISELKNDIQFIIDSSKSNTLSTKLQETKKDKLLLLKRLTEDLKRIHKTEQKSQTLINNIKKAHNENDSINFKSAQQKKSNDQISKIKIQKEIRKDSMNKYLDFIEEQKFYNKLDPVNIPGCLFLHDAIISSYGLCPYIKIDSIINVNHNQQLSDEQINNFIHDIYSKRKLWLDTQSDSGKLYWDIYDKLYNRKDLTEHYNNYNSLEKKIEEFILLTMSHDQKLMYDSCIDIIIEYLSQSPKNKTLKDKYKSVINNLSILVSQLGFDIHLFLSIKFNTTIVINILPAQNVNYNKFLIDEFDKLLNDFKLLNEDIKQNEKFITNSKNNLNNEMYLFLTNQKSFNLITSQPHFTQSKKYFKRWALLTESEKLERYESYANFYVDKYLINSNIIPHDSKNTYISTLITLLHNAHKSKKLIYRDIKWNIKDGIIETIKCLRFNKETNELYLNPSKVITSIQKKKVSTKTLFSKDIEKYVNEEILSYIVVFFQKFPDKKKRDEYLKENRDNCVEMIKNKLKIKKITNEDKKQILQKYDDMFSVVNHNQI